MGKTPEGRAELVSQRLIGVNEASAVAPLEEEVFLVACDEDGIFRCRPGADAVQMEASAGMRDLEGLCLAADRSAAYTIGEKDGGIWRFPLKDGDLGPGERIGKLPHIGKDKNQGWEGISYAPAGAFGDHDEIVACHQVRPRRIGFFDARTLRQRLELRLPKAAKKALGDLNDITIHPDTRHLLVLSGKAGCIAELRLVDEELELVRIYPVATAQGDVPEGIAFDAAGRLWIVTDGEGMLREIRLTA